MYTIVLGGLSLVSDDSFASLKLMSGMVAVLITHQCLLYLRQTDVLELLELEYLQRMGSQDVQHPSHSHVIHLQDYITRAPTANNFAL